MPAFTLRPYRPEDIAAITEIYHHYVLTSVATFDLTCPPQSAMAEKFAKMAALGHPILVAEGEDGMLLGYAYASTYRDRPAYRFTCEDSVYVRDGHHGQGIGRALLERLIVDGKAFGFTQMLGVITADSAGSIALHEKLGFHIAGRFTGLGLKFDRWLDVVHMQLSLTDR